MKVGDQMKPRKPRRRKVTLTCQCSEVEVFEDIAPSLDLSCNACGDPLEVQ